MGKLVSWMLTVTHRDETTERIEFVAVSGEVACEAMAKKLIGEGRTPLSVLYDDDNPQVKNVVDKAPASKNEQRAASIMKGYTGDACPECDNFTMVRNGTCLKCDTCGSTTGCS